MWKAYRRVGAAKHHRTTGVRESAYRRGVVSGLLWLAGFAIGLSCYAATAYLAGGALRWALGRVVGVRGRARAARQQAQAGAVVAALPVEPEWVEAEADWADAEPAWADVEPAHTGAEPGWADELDEIAA